MKTTDSDRRKLNDAILATQGIVDNMTLGSKYGVDAPYKFSGKKKKASNSGGQGRSGRRLKRHGKAKP